MKNQVVDSTEWLVYYIKCYAVLFSVEESETDREKSAESAGWYLLFMYVYWH
jgi:hypothetical protein